MLLSLSIAREIAYDTFIAVMENRKRPENVLADTYANTKRPIKRVDRNLIKEIVYGSLRWYSKIYWILQNTSRRNLDEVSPEIRTALVLGTYQIFYMDRIPDRAAVNESVEYIKKRGQGNASSFVNGILRQISRRAEYFAKPDKQKQSVEYLSLQFAHPKWIVERWFKRFGYNKCETMLASNNQPAPNTARLNTMKTPLDKSHEFQQSILKQEKTHSDRRPLRTCLRLKQFPSMENGSLFAQGYFTMQDEAAQLISLLVQPQEDENIVDACAGPGGKMTHIFELADGKATVTGIEKEERQFQRMEENITRLGHDDIKLLHSDFLNWNPGAKVDKVLLDAPCSGLGVLRRHPDAKWHKDMTNVQYHQQLQKDLIHHALKNIKAGGELIFAVCSFETEETYDHVKWMEKKYEGAVEMVSPVSRLPDFYKKYVTRENILLIYGGNNDQMDGFGAFIMKVNKEID